MKTQIIQIGNSKGVRIPKPLLEESGLKGEVEMILKDNEIVLRPIHEARESWDSAFKKMAQNKDDQLLDREEVESPSDWDDSEWTW